MPQVIGFSSRYDEVGEVDPRLANKIRLFVIVEDGNFQLVVVWGISDGKAQFLIPELELALRIHWEAQLDLPSWCLASSPISVGLFGFFA
jgi:hypothetical protein